MYVVCMLHCIVTPSLLSVELFLLSLLLFPDELVSLLPRLFPFMSHGIASVRESCLRAFLTLLKDSPGAGEAREVRARQQVYHCSEDQTANSKTQWVEGGEGGGGGEE